MRLARLPRLVTGIRDRGEPGRPHDPKAFGQARHAVAALENGRADGFSPDRVLQDHRLARIETRTESVLVLCNTARPPIAFQAGDREPADHRRAAFVSPIRIAALFEALTEFQTLDADWLMEEVTPDILAELGRAELDQVAYHRPERIGDIVFNDWD